MKVEIKIEKPFKGVFLKTKKQKENANKVFNLLKQNKDEKVS